jgi:hypothetical protein
MVQNVMLLVLMLGTDEAVVPRLASDEKRLVYLTIQQNWSNSSWSMLS